MSFHIGAQPDDIAPTVLMPGDPLRAEWAARTFLDGVRQVNAVRGMLGFTGTWAGHPVTIQGSGMGMPSLAIYATELITQYGARRLIRIGSCGAMQPHVALRDVVLAQAASAVSTPSATLLRELRFAPCADWQLLSAAARAAETRGIRHHVGGIYSSDTFYDERTDLEDQLVRHGTLAVEMEAAELYTLAARHGVQALAVLTVSDHLQTRESLDTAARERSFTDMVHVALDAAFPDG